MPDLNGARHAYWIRLVARVGTARPAEAGSAMSTSVTTVAAGAMRAVGPEPNGGRVTAASAAPLSTSSRFPSPRTSSDVSVAPLCREHIGDDQVVLEVLASVAAMDILRRARSLYLERRRLGARARRREQSDQQAHPHRGHASRRSPFSSTTDNLLVDGGAVGVIAVAPMSGTAATAEG